VIFVVCSIGSVQDSRMCTSDVNGRVKHWLVLHLGNYELSVYLAP